MEIPVIHFEIPFAWSLAGPAATVVAYVLARSLIKLLRG